MDTEEYVCLPEGSICESCIYCITRLIEPLDDEAYEIMTQEDIENNIFVHACCMLLDIDLHDHVVKGCNQYECNIEDNPFLNNKFLNGN